MKRKALLTTAAIVAALGTSAKISTLTPPVKNIEKTETTFRTDRKIKLNGTIRLPLAETIVEELTATPGAHGIASGILLTEIVDSIPLTEDYELAGYEAEGYRLSVAQDTIKVSALTQTGILRGLQTLRQLAQDSNGEIEGVEIIDWPAFKLRGWLHDIGRSYMSIEELKKEIDLLSRFKVNTFHWHLTENQAFRMESKKYPQLNSPESMSRHKGLYYTQEEMKDIEQYAAERGIIVIPEVDMPGHSEAFTKAMGHDMQTDEGVAELQQIIEEVCEAFPNAPYIHIGADEKRITYPDFLKIMIDKVHSMGRKVAVWNPIYGVTVNKDMNIDLVTLWSTAGRKVEGVPNVDLRYNYANHFDVFSDPAGIYMSNIYYSQKGDPELAGAISGFWNDRNLPEEKDIVKQNNMYASILASAERAWKGGGKEYIETSGVVIPTSGEVFDEFADWERRFLYHKDHTLPTEEIPYVKQTQVKWHLVGPYANQGNSEAVFPPEKSLEGLPDSLIIEAVGAAPMLRHYWGKSVPAYYSDPQLDNTSYAYTYIFSPFDQEAGALIEFHNYSRSEKDKAPDAGKWDRKGSRIWLNDVEIPAPVWENSSKEITNEDLLLNENFTTREPVIVELKEGWNKVLVKLPYVKADGIRLNKWMFTFVLTDKNGRNALENVVYSPTKQKNESN